MTTIKALRQLRGEHEFSLSDDFSTARKVITQTCYFKAGNIVVAIGELNSRNTWNDPAFTAACEFLTAAWNRAASVDGRRMAETRRGSGRSPTSAVGEAETPSITPNTGGSHG